MVAFDRPIGARGDTAELDYVCALHQACEGHRARASIHAADVRCMLKSRYGIQVSADDITRIILRSLAWTTPSFSVAKQQYEQRNEQQQQQQPNEPVLIEDESEQMDQMEMLTILLIPYLCKAQWVATGRTLPKGVIEPSTSILQMVCQIIQDDVQFLQRRSSSANNNGSASNTHGRGGSTPPRLTAAWIQGILRAYGEEDLAADTELIADMLRHCQNDTDNPTATNATTTSALVGGTTTTTNHAQQHHDHFTAQAFGQALTADVIRKYDPVDETRYSTSWQDAMDAFTLREHFQSMEFTTRQHNNNTITVTQSESQQQKQQPSIDEMVTMEDSSSPPYNNNKNTYENKRTKDSNNNHPVWDRVFTAPAIDLTAETYRSKSLVVVLLVGVMLNYLAYIGSTGISAYDSMYCKPLVRGDSWVSNAAALTCATSSSLLWWSVTFFGLSMFGIALVGLGTLGNSLDTTRPSLPLVGAAFVFLAIILPIALAEIDDEGALAYGPRFLRILATLPLVYVLFMHVLHFATSSMESQFEATLVRRPLQDEQNLKSAIQFKVNRLVDNAVEIHGFTDAASEQIVMSRFGHALHAFSKHHETERVGGFFWTWEQIWNGTINRREGVWYTARFLAANVAQYAIAAGVLAGGMRLTHASRDGVDLDTVARWLYRVLDSVLAAQEGDFGYNATGLTCSQISSRDVSGILTEICPRWPECDTTRNVELLCGLLDMKRLAEALLPSEGYMLTVPVAFGAIAAFLTAFFLALCYLPSVTSTTLKLRSGVMPTLHSSKIITYRKGQVLITLLFGSIFWSCLVASALVGSIVFLVLFFFLYDGTSYYAQRFFAFIIGALLAVLLRTLIMRLGRQKYFQAFYRTRPAGANIYFLALEWANFALTVAFALVRFVKLLIVATLSVGRIDTQILSDDVTYLGPIDMDAAPTMHTRDILIHEAHRHPYIEALGSFYLTKLRYGDEYCTRAGSTWRLIFVYALMPWMQKHRIAGEIEESKHDVEGTDGVSSFSTFSKAYPSRLVAQTNDDMYDENERLRRELTRLRVLMTARQGKSKAEMDSISMFIHDAQQRISSGQDKDNTVTRSGDEKKKKEKTKRDPPPTHRTFAMPAITEYGDVTLSK